MLRNFAGVPNRWIWRMTEKRAGLIRLHRDGSLCLAEIVRREYPCGKAVRATVVTSASNQPLHVPGWADHVRSTAG
jgi:hypothetical protein